MDVLLLTDSHTKVTTDIIISALVDDNRRVEHFNYIIDSDCINGMTIVL